MTQVLSEKGAAFLRHHEGFVDHWYLDPVGVPTIGVGFTWLSDSFQKWWKANKKVPFQKGATMTREEADDALIFMSNDEYGKAVARHYGKKVPQHVFDGSVSPAYNLGVGSLEWKWADAAKLGDLATAADLLRKTGTTAKGKKLRGLEIRREEEAQLLEFGDYAIGTKEVYNDPLEDGVLVKGERGQPVIDLQKQLASLGFYTGALDGIFGHGTEEAVMSYQRSVGLVADGYAGPNTLSALSAGSNGPPSEPRPVPPGRPAEPSSGEKQAGGLAVVVLFSIVLAVVGIVWFIKSAFGG